MSALTSVAAQVHAAEERAELAEEESGYEMHREAAE
jgi:hypothetical protein